MFVECVVGYFFIIDVVLRVYNANIYPRPPHGRDSYRIKMDLILVVTFPPTLICTANCINCFCKYQIAASLMFTDLMQLDVVNRLDTTCW